MPPLNLLILIAFTLLIAWIVPLRWRGWAILAGSVLAAYWLQPSVPIRNLDFWLPTLSIALTILTWSITAAKTRQTLWGNRIAFLAIFAVILLVAILRYLGSVCCLTPTRPPQLFQVLVALGVVAGLAVLISNTPARRFLSYLMIFTILVLFVILKSGWFAQQTSAGLRGLMGQDSALASTLDLRWLGFSFLAFRLLHVLRDSQQGRLPDYSLDEFVSYALFYPSYTSGPIDRSQRFIQQDLRHLDPLTAAPLFSGGQRIVIGLFKKFVLADSLAMIALSPQNAGQVSSTLWIWVLLYAYALRLYFDFSGYTDIAIGLGKFLGIHLPENFASPYTKVNLTAFWNSWHITLAQWFRAYVFNPLTRLLRSQPDRFPAWFIILVGQLTTMLLIGLWHGITWNFAVWGLWHAIGLFIHNRWSGWIRPRYPDASQHKSLHKLIVLGGWFLTFQYVTLSWVWFALPSIPSSLLAFQKLFGL
jgi:alginate O-acetyltransferase complex protein AlgI